MKKYDKYGRLLIEQSVVTVSTIVTTAITADYVVAGAAVSSGDTVYLRSGGVYRYDASSPSTYAKNVGVSLQSGVTGDTVTVVYSGEAYVSGFGLTPEDVYYADPTNPGKLTTTPVGPGVLQLMGVAKDSDTLIVDIKQPVILI
jgi:hypothetical protein